MKDLGKKKENKKGFDQPGFFASCPRECEGLLEKEIKDLGITRVYREKGGVYFRAETSEATLVMLKSRIASRLFHEIQTYTIANERELYALAKEKWWDKIFDLKQTFMIKTLFDNEAKHKFPNSLIFSQLLKDAIADQFREKFGERPSVDTVNPDVSLLLRVQKKATGELFNAQIYVDMCGEPLSNRGYREVGFTAPLRENLAAAIVMSTDFDPNKDVFIDSMCGSGSILIEALLIKGNIAPTYLRVRPYVEKKQITFDCLKHNWFLADKKAARLLEEQIQAVYSQSIDALQKLETGQFLGFDISEQSLAITRGNLRSARIPEQIVSLNKRDATKIHAIEEAPALIICNPPYGERLGEEEKLKTLYHEYGENLKQNFKGYRAYIFTAKPDLRKQISLQTKARIPFFNGNLECRLLKYELY